MDAELKEQTKKGLIWSAIQRFSSQGAQFVFTIIIARQLTPEDYGVVGMLGVFLAVASVFVDGGFTNALIRKQDRTQADLSTVFYFNIIIGLLAYLVIFAIAPFVANFYDMPVLKNVLRVFGLTIIINSFCAIQMTLFNIKIDFKTQTTISLISIFVSGVVALGCAFAGMTYWTLVIQALISSLVTTSLYWIMSNWRPICVFSKQSFHEMFSFGSKLLVQGLINNIYGNIYPIIIGKLFAASTLGNYTRAQSFANFPSVAMTGIMQRVTYPVLCRIQDNEHELAYAYRKFLRLSAFVIFPLMTGLAALSTQFVILTIGKKWLFCAFLLQILCFSVMWYPIHAINLNLLQVKGRTDLSLRLEIIKKIVGIAILCISAPFGIVAMCYFQILSCLFCLIINTYYTGKLINLGFLKQMRDLTPTFIISIAMFGLILLINSVTTHLWQQVVIGVVIGGLFYLIMSYLFNKSEWKTIMSLIKK